MVGSFKRRAPIFAVHDLDAALAHYQRLGFATRAEWRSGGVELHGPEDTEWGQHEGAMVDPDGDVIRFGSSLRPK